MMSKCHWTKVPKVWGAPLRAANPTRVGAACESTRVRAGNDCLRPEPTDNLAVTADKSPPTMLCKCTRSSAGREGVGPGGTTGSCLGPKSVPEELTRPVTLGVPTEEHAVAAIQTSFRLGELHRRSSV